MAYNLKRAVNILGVPKLIAALRERYVPASNTVLHLIRALLRGAVRLGNECSHSAHVRLDTTTHENVLQRQYTVDIEVGYRLVL